MKLQVFSLTWPLTRKERHYIQKAEIKFSNRVSGHCLGYEKRNEGWIDFPSTDEVGPSDTSCKLQTSWQIL